MQTIVLKLWEEKNSGKKKAGSNKWRKENPDLLKIYSKRDRQKRAKQIALWRRQNPERIAWCSIIQRCTNPKCKPYKNYGGRGIKVLYKDFDEFLVDVGPRLSPKHTIDRIDNDGNYEVGNCRWTTWKVQQNNKRGLINFTEDQIKDIRQKYIPYKYSISKLAKEYGVSRSTIYNLVNPER